MDPITEQPANIIVTNQPTKSNELVVTGPVGQRVWSSGLFECFDDIVLAVLTCFFMPCMECYVANRMGECFIMPYCVCGGTLAMRTKLRIMGGIHGSIMNDAFILQYCAPCAVCQMSRELDIMGIL
ncbi:cornifelin homolog B-like [Mizuhopecten yessoensis]|uniref:Cornifelin n=1 Tax=Mizuhopecten yessoensis TaxID=6573 RepID=A0A210QB03_MIZYE|nr:cornifelin homolog B-like [Mizuhopecten yessoensis]OWF45906.1 Cornifelin [Mizuhopecten yessoensis]